MTCKCGYEFCFKCGARWRSFHFCNPFHYKQYRNTGDNGANQIPTASQYVQFVLVVIMKVFWAIFTVAYMIPLILLGYLLSVISMMVASIVVGISYGYFLFILEAVSSQKYKAIYILLIIVFPLAMIKGIYNVFKLNGNKYCVLWRIIVKIIDIILPFSWIPYRSIS